MSNLRVFVLMATATHRPPRPRDPETQERDGPSELLIFPPYSHRLLCPPPPVPPPPLLSPILMASKAANKRVGIIPCTLLTRLPTRPHA